MTAFATPVDPGSRLSTAAQPRQEPEFRAPGVSLLFAARIPAWLIACLVVIGAHRPDENTKHEPLLLALSWLPILAGVLYTPLLRRSVSRAFPERVARSTDLLTLAAIDMLAVFAVIYFSGGFNTPYYHYAIVALLIPSFLLGWRASLLVLVAFLVGLVTMWVVAGYGTDGPWDENLLGYGVPGALITPVLVVFVSQYLAWLVRRVDDRRQETRRALETTAVLYEVAYASSVVDTERELVEAAATALQRTSHFVHLSIWSAESDALQRLAGAGDGPVLAQNVSRAVPANRLTMRTVRIDLLEAWVTPLTVRDHVWGVVVFEPATDMASPETIHLVESVAGQLSLGLTRIVLTREQEVLAAEEERSKIAREIHDGIAQSIYMLSLDLEKASAMAQGEGKLGPRLVQLVSLARQTLIEVRHYIFDLKPLLAGDVSLANTLESQAREFSTASGIPVTLNVEGVEPGLPVATQAALFRILQEALANALRHARASAITVRLAFGASSIVLDIIDDGMGFDWYAAIEGSGFGLQNMRERAVELGGQMHVITKPGIGTTVHVEIPIAEVASHAS